jgi:O-acetyl-ADP-ribose deacetylase (regulator of RNase III)
VAFPSLSTGAYRFPVDLAARTALRSVMEFLRDAAKPKLVRFVLFDQGAYGAFAAALEEIQQCA